MNFPKHKFELKLKNIHFDSLLNNDKNIQKTCEKIQLLKAISIVMPDADTSDLEHSLKYSYYTIDEFKVHDILNKSLIDGYINNGDFVAASLVDKHSDHNCHLFVSNRTLQLRLDKDTYYSLNAACLTKYRKKNEPFTFEIDLAEKHLDKIRHELQSDELRKVKLCFLWNPASDDICPSSIAKFFSNDGYAINSVSNQSVSTYLFDRKFPLIPSSKEAYEWQEFYECIGMMMLDCDVDNNTCSSYQMPEETLDVGRVQVLHFKGFIPHFILDKMFRQVLTILKENSQMPYIALTAIPCSSLQRNIHTKSLTLSVGNIHVAE